jgi:hypothetical protein
MSFDIQKEDRMPRKRPTPEEIVGKLRQVDVLAAQGRSIADAVRAIGARSEFATARSATSATFAPNG